MPHAKTDFQGARRLTTEDGVQVQLALIQIQAEAWPAEIDAAFLGLGHPAGAHDEAANGAARMTCALLPRCSVGHFGFNVVWQSVGRVFGRVLGHLYLVQKKVPASGEEALA